MKNFFKHPWLIIIICLVLTGILGFQLKGIKLDNSITQYLPQQNDSYKRLEATEDQFGTMVTLGVSIETKDKSIVTKNNMDVINTITKQIEAVKNVDSVDSITNIDYVYGADGALIAGSIVGDDYTGTPDQIAEIKDKLNDWSEMYNRVIISDNGKAAQLQVMINCNASADEQQEVLNNVRLIVNTNLQEAKAKGILLDAKLFGEPVISEDARTFMLTDLSGLIPLVIVVVLLSLLISFKTLDGTLLPLLTVVMSTAWTCGLMAVFNVTFTIVSSVIPVALIAVGSAYGIHVLTHYYIAIKQIEGEITHEKYLEAVKEGLKDVIKAVVLAGATTIVGFISLVTSPIVPLKSFALFTALGVLFALLLSITFIPACLLIKPLNKVGAKSKGMEKLSSHVQKRMDQRAKRRGGRSPEEAESTTLYNVYHAVAGTRPRLIIFSLIIVVFSVVGLHKLVIDTALVNYFPKDCRMRQDLNYVDKNFAGANSVYLLIAGQNKGDMTKPEILGPVDNMETYLQDKYDGIGKVVSFTTFIKRMNQVMHIPDSANTPAEATKTSDTVASFDDGFSGFGDDSFGSDSSATTTDGFTGFGDDSFGEDSTATIATAPVTDYVDPNASYVKGLAKTITVQEGLALMNKAYSDAGGKKATVESMVSELEKQFNYNGEAYNEIPTDVSKYPVADSTGLANLVSQYLLLFSGSMDRFSDDPLAPKTIRVMMQLRSHSTVETGEIISDAKDYAAKYFPEGYTLEATGVGEMEYVMSNMVVNSQLKSLLFSLIAVFIIISVAFKSGKAGFLGALPLAFTIILNYMVMGFTGIHLDLVTSIIASVAIGVGIDYTIHFLTTYKAERGKSDDLEAVALATFQKSGPGIVTNALAVGLGFLVLCLSRFIVLRYIGLLIAIVMFTSSLLAMTIIPGVLSAFDPKFMHPNDKYDD
jgi:predicted RND superfamily exporter protein